MSRAAIIAFGAVSALGEGAHAAGAGEVGEAARVQIGRDPELESAGLSHPFVARVRRDGRHEAGAANLLERALSGCASALDRARPGWRRERVGLVLGTSSGGMRAAERAFAALERGERVLDPEATTYFGPVARAARGLDLVLDPTVVVLGACASSAIAIGIASRWVEAGTCDVALAGGFDDVTVFVAAGFEVLRATTASPPPRPFRIGRDGMSLGEGAAVLALARADAGARAYVAGFGAASDAVHLTAPDREGGGLSRAALAALDDAGGPAVDLVSAHATATPFNDAAEWRAIVRALGGSRAREAVVHPFKAQIGHTLGAAGALEALACLDAMARGVLPAAAGNGSIDPDTPARLLARTAVGHPRVALKLSAAFGGANAALVLAAEAPNRARAFRHAYVHAAVHVDREPPLEWLAACVRMSANRLARADGLVRLALFALAQLEQQTGPLAGAGMIAGSPLATLETNAVFAARMRQRGAVAAEPRRFPYTSPNATPGECSIAFGLTGPTFSVGGGMHAAVEALATGAVLVEAGDAERMAVVAVDEAGPVTRALFSGALLSTGAVAVLLSADPRGARARVGEVTLRRGPGVAGPLAPGHLALLPLAAGEVPGAVESATPPDAIARVVLHRA